MRLPVAIVAMSCACAAAPVGAEGGRVLSRYKGTPLAVVTPAPMSEPAAAALWRAKAASADAAPEKVHRVAPGETVWRIARSNGVTVEALMAHNGLSDPSKLRVGQELRMPPNATVAASKPAAGQVVEPAATAKAETARAAPASSRYPLTWPAEGSITSRYGSRWGRSHDGIDIGAPLGAEVRAAADGEVLFADRHGTYGNLVVLRHADGLVTVYAHHQMNLVRKGQRVKSGQPIAKVGQSGRASGPHLHFEVRRGARPENPLRYLPP